MKRNWTSVGADYNDTPEQKKHLSDIFDGLSWGELKQGLSLPMGPGMAIEEAIKELRIPKPSHYALSNELAPYGLIAIRGHFKNGRADVYLLDEGHQCVVLASDFHPKQ